MRLLSRINHVQFCNTLKQKCHTMNTDGNGVKLSQVVQFLTSFAPLTLAESWDNVGLLVEPPSSVLINKVLLTIDLTEAVMKEAVEERANMIIAYHPPIFQPLKRITTNKWKERLIATCLENKIAVFSPHTTWDSVKGGLSDWLASPFDFESVEPLLPSVGQLTKKAFSHHITVFCPHNQKEKCVNVFSQNLAEIVSETSLDTSVKFSVIVQKKYLMDIESALNETQSYYSIYERNSVPPKDCGTGRFGKLKRPIKISEAVDKLKNLVDMPQIRLSLEQGKSMESSIQSVAVVAGSGASVLRGVRADLYVTGEMLHHDLLEASHTGASVALINHSDSERGYLKHFAPHLRTQFGDQLSVCIAKNDKDPIIIV